MIQNELLPGCAVIAVPAKDMKRHGADETEVIYDGKEYSDLARYKPIPLTAESVAKVEGGEYVWEQGYYPNEYYKWEENGQILCIYTDGRVFLNSTQLDWISAIHDAQILIKQAITGTMPKYEIG
jgi:hypothetical protein